MLEGGSGPKEDHRLSSAIEFGSINPVAGQKTRVAAVKEEAADYSLLRELTTKPRTTYLAAVRNPNPEIKSGKKETLADGRG